MGSAAIASASDLATPPGGGGLLGGLLQNQALPALAARLGAGLAASWGGPFVIGGTAIAARHADVREALARDLDFQIAPINAKRMDEVNGPFVLGMDRNATLAKERHALYKALAIVDKEKLRARCEREADDIVAGAGGSLDVVGAYARPIAARTAKALFGVSGASEPEFMDVTRAIFAHTFLNIGDDAVIRERALKAAALMRKWFKDEIARRRPPSFGDDMMGALLAQGALDHDGVRHTLGGMLVGSVDTTATAVAKIIKMLASDDDVHDRVVADLGDERRLAGWCMELLRLWPHNPILLRRCARDTELGGVSIGAGATVVLWTQAAMLDASAFPEPQRLRPDRPMSAYLHFGAGLHPCAGRAINDFQIPILVGRLVRRGVARASAVSWAGPFPDRLDVTLGERRP